ncbi:hypothetical protein ACFTZK_01440 [Streptomyces decoyicus]|uniref:hypothetical protein n=1 Tax=Streptomyces decoyicus TaxID=249567 RepID=UPI00362F9DDE
MAGRAADLALQETALTCGVMLAKDALRHAPDRLPDPRRYLADAGGAPTPHEYMWARWWDAAMLPYFRLGFGSPPYRMLDDDGAGTFDVSFRCHRIRRAIDNSYRYNEIIGILTDYAHGEPATRRCWRSPQEASGRSPDTPPRAPASSMTS